MIGVTAFLQKSDHKLKSFGAVQSLVYSVHFVLLGNFPAAASSGISSVRSWLALKPRSSMVPAAIIVCFLAAGSVLAKSGAGWITIVASCVATVAIFKMKGVSMRLILLGCTFMWLTNNILSRSIGGIMLEGVIAVANAATIVRMFRASNEASAVPAGEVLSAGD